MKKTSLEYIKKIEENNEQLNSSKSLNILNEKNTLLIDAKNKTNKIKIAEKRIIKNSVEQSNSTVVDTNLQNNLNKKIIDKSLEKTLNNFNSKKNLNKLFIVKNNSIIPSVNPIKTHSDKNMLPLTLNKQKHLTKINNLQYSKLIQITTKKEKEIIKPTKLVSTASRPSLIKTGSNTNQKNKPRWI